MTNAQTLDWSLDLISFNPPPRGKISLTVTLGVVCRVLVFLGGGGASGVGPPFSQKVKNLSRVSN